MAILLREHTLAKPQGYVHRELADGRVFEFDLMQCIHCQYTWRFVKGSGTERGWCPLCSGPLCGAEACMRACVHFEKRLEIVR